MAVGTPFSFTLDGSAFTVAVGDCRTFTAVGAGPHTIVEIAHLNAVLSQITVSPATAIVSLNVAARSVTVTVPDFLVVTVTFINRTHVSNQGCTPGFWKQDFHFNFWIGLSPTQTVGSVFTGLLPSLSSETLLDALQGGGGPGLLGAEEILLRAAVAALLNASNGNISFPFPKAAIITAVNAAVATGDRDVILALATILDNANNGVGGCPLSGHDLP